MKTFDLTHGVLLAMGLLLSTPTRLAAENAVAEQWSVFEKSFSSIKRYDNPFTEVELDVVFRCGESQWRVPAFWAGGERWKVRFAPPIQGSYTFHLKCSDPANGDLNGNEQSLQVTAYKGNNPLLARGFLRIAPDQRHFVHADGTPFLWLADTWWKCLSQRMTWDGFQELTADRKGKGFNAVQMVCGPYPDENMMQRRWENEGGMPYLTKDFREVNPRYFEFADRRIQHLVEAGIVPVIVGGWGRPQAGGQSTLEQVGLDGFKRHWRNLIARYGAYPTVWIVGGEAQDSYGPWSELARYVRAIDPYSHPLCYHAPAHPRQAIRDNAVFDFDMVAIGHEGMKTAVESLNMMKACWPLEPKRPVLCGEACYEGHMQTNFQDVQRHLFWTFLLSGAAGHTYGAAGVWQASVEGDPGIDPVYDWTTWKEGMNYPGSAQLGLGKRLLEQFPWSRFEAHPEWVDQDCFAAGIPGEVRFIYQPKRNIYNWSGPLVKGLEPNLDWHVFYFDPATARRFDQGILKAKSSDASAKSEPVMFRTNVPSPQDWILVLEKVPPTLPASAQQPSPREVHQPGLKRPFVPTHHYSTTNLAGWTVHINRDLLSSEAALGSHALEVLVHHLCTITNVVPPTACARLQQVPVWLGVNDGHAECAEYHPSRDWLAENGYNPEKAQCVEIGNAQRFVAWTAKQPMMVLHELAHAYHDRVLGFSNSRIRKLFEQAKASGRYDAVPRNDGTKGRAYAMEDDHEYFAEVSEAYFGTNDYYPFTRAELKQHDPEMFALLEEVWN